MTHEPKGQSSRQFLKFVVVGVINNVLGYLVYLGLVELGLVPKLAMTLTYVTGSMIGFLGNRNFTFSHRDGIISSGSRYLLTCATGYVANLLILVALVDVCNYPHQLAQAVAIVVVALLAFFMLKFFVFPRRPQSF